jgi:hypothetical protein
VHLLILQ